MSSRVCYIEREDRGAVLRSLRVLGAQADDTWRAPSGGADIGQHTFASAAAWIGDRLNGRIGGRVLDRLCLDVDGAVCSWVTSNSTDARLVRAVIEQEAAQESEDPFSEAGLSHAGRFPDLPGEVGYQALPAGRLGADGPVRTPVFAVPDVAARAFIDALDESGIQIGSCLTLWQAMLKAWVAQSGSAHERVVAEASPVVAVVLCVPGDRIVWAWGKSDSPIAAGAFRMRSSESLADTRLLEDSSDDQGDGIPAASFGGRLATEWLAWSAQIGRVPSRVVWVGPVGSRPGFGGGEIASALLRAAPGSSVDVVDEDDPVGLTLRRLAERIDSGADRLVQDDHLVGLSNRPGRVHRAMYHWLAALLLAASGAILALAWDFWNQRGDSVRALGQVRANQRELLEAEAPDLVSEPAPFAIMTLKDRVARARGPATVAIPPPKPVMRELETLAFVLGNPEYELLKIDISSMSISFQVKVKDTAAFEQLQNSLFGIGGSYTEWTPLNKRQHGGGIEVTGNGTWDLEDPPVGGAT